MLPYYHTIVLQPSGASPLPLVKVINSSTGRGLVENLKQKLKMVKMVILTQNQCFTRIAALQKTFSCRQLGNVSNGFRWPPRGPLQTVSACRTSSVDSPGAQGHPQTPSTLRERVPRVKVLDRVEAKINEKSRKSGKTRKTNEIHCEIDRNPLDFLGFPWFSSIFLDFLDFPLVFVSTLSNTFTSGLVLEV